MDVHQHRCYNWRTQDVNWKVWIAIDWCCTRLCSLIHRYRTPKLLAFLLSLLGFMSEVCCRRGDLSCCRGCEAGTRLRTQGSLFPRPLRCPLRPGPHKHHCHVMQLSTPATNLHHQDEDMWASLMMILNIILWCKVVGWGWGRSASSKLLISRSSCHFSLFSSNVLAPRWCDY